MNQAENPYRQNVFLEDLRQHKNREHKSNLTMLTVDLHLGLAYQRCWDAADCVVHVGGGRVKAKHRLPRPPASALPELAALEAFERDTDARDVE